MANAGIWRRGLIEELSEDEWRQTIDVNLTSAFRTCQLAAREMKPRKRGKVILISSTAGQRGEANYTHYAASKAGLISLSQVVARFGAKDKIRSNTVAAGIISSDMGAAGMQSPAVAKAAEAIMLGELGTFVDVAQAVIFLKPDSLRQLI